MEFLGGSVQYLLATTRKTGGGNGCFLALGIRGVFRRPFLGLFRGSPGDDHGFCCRKVLRRGSVFGEWVHGHEIIGHADNGAQSPDGGEKVADALVDPPCEVCKVLAPPRAEQRGVVEQLANCGKWFEKGALVLEHD